MSPRKSPYKHKVRAHKRLGRPVRKYERGKGRKPAQSVGRRRRRIVVGKPVVVESTREPFTHSAGGYDITITYFDRDVERFEVEAKKYEEAITVGEERRGKAKPIRMIRMRG